MSDTTATLTAPRSRTLNRVLWAAQILLALFMIFASGLPKIFGVEFAVQIFDQIGIGQWFRYLVGALEVAGGIGLLIPRLAGLAALCLVGLMIGATITNLGIIDLASSAPMSIGLGVVFAVIAWVRRDEIAASFARR